MIGENKQPVINSLLSCVKSIASKFVMVITFATLILGLSLFTPKNKPALANAVLPSFCPPLGGGCGCAVTGQTFSIQRILDFFSSQLTTRIINRIQDSIRETVTREIGFDIFGTIDSILEGNMQNYWTQMWEVQIRPSFQAFTAQLHTIRTEQSKTIGAFIDGQNFTFVQNKIQQSEIDASRKVKPSELTCMAATQAGGFSRANSFVRAVRFGMEDEKNNMGLNTANTLGAEGKGAIQYSRWRNFLNIFCDTRLNAGQLCANDGLRPNADVMPTATLLNPLTIDIKDNAIGKAAETAMDNLAGFDMLDPMRPKSVLTTTGRRFMLERRALLAKRAAARSVNMLTSLGWRSRGSNMSVWVREFSNKTGTQIPVSADPSYYEVMNSITKYKFLSGRYGAELIQDPLNIEREKLISSSLYLMQLRDYFELLERVALTAAVDTSIMLDGYVNAGGGFEAVVRPK